ncbi:MAG: serine acetyltransferase [Clostridia bacterium]|nr:serine acetyltransferase [Clostridia bacterium]
MAIQNYEDYLEYSNEDKKRNGAPSLKNWITWNDNYGIQCLLYILRKVEFHSSQRGFYHKIAFEVWYWLFRRQRVRTNIMLFPGTIGPGIQLMHPGYRRIGSFVKIGKNCTILPMVLCGRRHPDDKDSLVVIGDNCYISTGVTILGPVTIGNNVVIGAGAVVNKDIPDNTVVGGIPAKVIKVNM